MIFAERPLEIFAVKPFVIFAERPLEIFAEKPFVIFDERPLEKFAERPFVGDGEQYVGMDGYEKHGSMHLSRGEDVKQEILRQVPTRYRIRN